VFGAKVSVMFITYEPVPEAHDIFKRFGKVFEQTYIRFLDLQKAEAQAREAQIQLSLERIRAKAMAMQHSDELSGFLTVLFEQFEVLNLRPVNCHLSFFDIDNNRSTFRMTGKKGATLIATQEIDLDASPLWKQNVENWKSGLPNDVSVLYIPYESLKETADIFKEILSKLPEDERPLPEDFPDGDYVVEGYCKYGYIGYNASRPPSDEEKEITGRIANEFGNVYQHFLDLQKAEAQAKEAQIEAALERVRGKAMAMHSSEDLAAAIRVFYLEMKGLSVTPRRLGVGLVSRKNRIAEISSMNTTEKGESIEVLGKLEMTGHPVLNGIYDHWLLQKEYHPVLRGNEIREYYTLIRPHIAYPDYPTDAVQFGYFFPFTEGSIYAWTEQELHEDELKIYRKFTSVLSLTYKRYKDLKDAEANAHEAVRRASLDRVRAEIASMRTMDDLQRITPIIWHELTVLGIPFVRCGVFIMNEITEHIQVYLSAPDGRSLAALDLPFNSSELTLNSVNHWRQGIIFKTHWNKQEFLNFMQSMIKLGQVSNQKTYQGAAEPPESLDLHFVPFKQGMLYVGNTSSLEKEALELVKSLAESFSIAYARYEDFRQLESAKNQIEKTFTELKAAQAQLIQAEKMASLGELTAGIAHEIQNPLNFVNNFSEISNELVEELKGERIKDKGERDEELEGELLNDISQNLEKINHHGKRAADIVKGMLQHSRTSSGVKEPTDINALADEYLRLAYHGLRAKDKSFNAKMDANFDETIGKINVIPQDIGRVILNLITNAFYVVDEKKKRLKDGYEPIVSVSTKRIDNQIFISVKDNGNGIPKHILDKIFQPFFTTKPTGQGTGLGLSLSYDIVKAHGGELKVETKEGVGSEFIIQIPINLSL
jgi:signal transduction histidine kinase